MHMVSFNFSSSFPFFFHTALLKLSCQLKTGITYSWYSHTHLVFHVNMGKMFYSKPFYLHYPRIKWLILLCFPEMLFSQDLLFCFTNSRTFHHWETFLATPCINRHKYMTECSVKKQEDGTHSLTYA